jgi:NAD(P)-dependent dehydrogenase (short-subunit alcohol dehydrogenase family)
MVGICEGRVVAITGAGRGIGRAHALEFARQGARVVVNDLGGARDGTGASAGPAEEVAAEIVASGGDAIASHDDISDTDGAQAFIAAAVDHFGRLDTLVNNAGILRDRMIFNMSTDDWDAVVRVHLRGTFLPTKYAAQHWRDCSKAGDAVAGRLVNTSSSSGLYANPGQANYAAAKSGIASFTIVASRELSRYGVLANAIYPTALSRMTEDLFSRGSDAAAPDEPDGWRLEPANIAPVVAWLGSDHCNVTGQVLGVRGGSIVVAENWRPGPSIEVARRWDPAELDAVIPDLVARAVPATTPQGAREQAQR